jgi:hypothetical protein
MTGPLPPVATQEYAAGMITAAGAFYKRAGAHYLDCRGRILVPFFLDFRRILR